ncbi:uncharacterized protein LOC119876283 [Canis lupus familiaris]|uniref:uncharacterized protein LOC119876283 n=1 Tax=Canis lupus familiaris TaxID=9615 RepID=UPI0018F7D9F8|nr:uncharacterized protein LOC119876283 [Canis lupus familiaris]
MREQPSGGGGRESAVGAGRGSGPGRREGAPLVPRDRLPSLHACLPAVTLRWEGCSGKPPEAGGCSGAHAGLGEQEGAPAALLPPRGLGHSGGRHPSGLVPGDYPAHPRRFPLLPRAVPAARSLIRPGLRSRRRATCGGRVFVRRCLGPCKAPGKGPVTAQQGGGHLAYARSGEKRGGREATSVCTWFRPATMPGCQVRTQDQLMKPSLYVRPWFPCACISRTPILGATNGEREKMDGACSPLPGFVYTYVYSEDGHLCTEKHEIPRSACWGVALASLTVDCTVSA